MTGKNEIEKLPPIFFPSDGKVDEELFCPLSRYASSIDCMVGYFSSGYISELARSVTAYINSNRENKMRFIVSPNFEKKDVEEIQRAYNRGEDFFEHLFPNNDIQYNTLKSFSVKSLAYLVVQGRIEIKVALKRKGLFHTKCWLFRNSSGDVAVHGSSNATQGGMINNFEQLVVSRSWLNDDSFYICQELTQKFERLWQGGGEDISVIPLNEKTVCKIREVAQDFHFDDLEIKAKLDEVLEEQEKSEGNIEDSLQKKKLRIPEYMNYTEGDFKHQGEAVASWFNNDCAGILSIATGGGKTYTSLIAATKLMESIGSLLAVVAVPTKTLIDQWERDVAEFGVSAINTNGMSKENINKNIKGAMRQLRLGSSMCEVIIITHDALCSGVLSLIQRFSQEKKALLIADEVHNLGGPKSQLNIPEFFKYKLGLSATHERQFDPDGTDFLIRFFGRPVYEFGLDEAIGKCLVEYDYFVHEVFLNAEEEEDFQDLTYEIKKVSFAAKESSDTPAKARWQRLCLQRRALVESSINKVKVFEDTLKKVYGCQLGRALVFCTDKNPQQLVEVNKLLIDLGVSFHQITAIETSRKDLVNNIISSFSSGELQAITSKRVLDEGFNIPQTELAFILASNTVKRQWTQRLGRVLRLSPKTGKSKAVIHDFLVIPAVSGEVDEDLKSLIESEYKRVSFFTSYSSNKSDPKGGVNAINTLLEKLGAL